MASLVLFVCTGNTCRSPMAEALLRSALPAPSSWRIASAGLAAAQGAPASHEAVAVTREIGVDLQGHRSQPVSDRLVQAAVAIVVMTDAHAQQIAARYPAAREKLFLLRTFDPDAPDRSNLVDPYCGSLDDYRLCRDLIRRAIPGLIDFLTHAASVTD